MSIKVLSDMGLQSSHPKVSVIIPNYNHARHLPERIESVLNQSLQEIEVILMDDCSPDNSRDIIARYAAQDGRIRVVLNEQNSGSTFKQWNKGFSLAKGEYVWIAESDDYAESNFLETLVPKLEADSSVGLAYCDSFSVDENGLPMPVPIWEPFLAELDANLWKSNFTHSGLDLVQRFMSYRNIIPNASAVLLRSSVLKQVGPADESFKVLGDWLFWAKILSISSVSFTVQPLNYFRTHRNNARTKNLENGTALVENTRMLAAMQQYGKPSPLFYQKSLSLLLETWFHSLVYYKMPLSKHWAAYKNMVAFDGEFKAKFTAALRHFLFRNKLSGVKMLLGDKLLYPLLKKSFK